MRITLSTGDQEVTGTLEDNPVTRDLMSLLPVTVPMSDLFGREKLGPLPRALTGDVEPVLTYRIGQIAYWPPATTSSSSTRETVYGCPVRAWSSWAPSTPVWTPSPPPATSST
ncbi:cyclophilin-like fold protein [Blastococcus brunescens]|uniref:Cyclophilin-like fold protein n=1 Tax=Blastococcus brunescens TaxID=1564165 RepID=A0ABZ1B3U3_9ACTN|nr:cyclophilin-like fold protein [Blastococcus sp. BMG 8361]WRL65458.1 cyclophilin-like fold protein [Blastococcus sp. BMG 8361]